MHHDPWIVNPVLSSFVLFTEQASCAQKVRAATQAARRRIFSCFSHLRAVASELACALLVTNRNMYPTVASPPMKSTRKSAITPVCG